MHDSVTAATRERERERKKKKKKIKEKFYGMPVSVSQKRN
jgi:hypothetical protein